MRVLQPPFLVTIFIPDDQSSSSNFSKHVLCQSVIEQNSDSLPLTQLQTHSEGESDL